MRIAIVGAGPAGLDAAESLNEKGYSDIVIFEKSDRAGGKCVTVDHLGKKYDLGAIMVGSGYHRVLFHCNKYGEKTVEGPYHFIHEGDLTQGKKVSLPRGVLGFLSLLSAAWVVATNFQIRKKPLSELAFKQFYKCSIDDFFNTRFLARIRHMFAPITAGCGYGFTNTTPIIYLLKLVYLGLPRSTLSLIKLLRFKLSGRRGSLYTPMTLENGFGGLLQKMASVHNIHYNEGVTSISHKNGVVLVSTNKATYMFDRIIFAIPPKDALAVTSKYSTSVATLLKQTRNVCYFSALIHVPVAEKLPRGVYFDNSKLSDKSKGKHATTIKLYDNDCGLLFYGVGDDSTSAKSSAAEAVKDFIISNYVGLGIGSDSVEEAIESSSVIEGAKWAYFPHVNPEELHCHYAMIESLQGQNKSFFVGEWPGFACVEGAMENARDVVKRYF